MTGLTPTTAAALSMLQTTRSDIRLIATPHGVRALAAIAAIAVIIVAKKRVSQAGTTVTGPAERIGHDKNILD
jgi:hypothetical protein